MIKLTRFGHRLHKMSQLKTNVQRQISQQLRKEVMQLIEQEDGVYEKGRWEEQVAMVVKKADELIVEEDLFENPLMLRRFVQEVKNNNILLDYLLKYEDLVDFSVLVSAFSKFTNNFENLDRYKQEAIDDFQKKVEEFKKIRGIDADVGIQFSQRFLVPAEFQQQAMYHLFMDKIVTRVIESELQQGRPFNALYLLNTIADQDPRHPNSEIIETLIKRLKKPNIFTKKFLVESGEIDSGLTYLYFVRLILRKNNSALVPLTEIFLPKIEGIIWKHYSLISRNTLAELIVDLYEPLDALNQDQATFLTDVIKYIQPVFSDLSLSKLLDLMRLYEQREQAFPASGLTKLPKKKSITENLTIAEEYIPLLIKEIHSKLIASMRNEVIKFRSVRSLFNSKTEILLQLQRTVLENFPSLEFAEDNLPYVSLLRFYFEKLIDFNMISRVRLSFISDYLAFIDKQNLDTENFSYVYFHLTLFGHFSMVLARDYADPILRCFQEKKLIATLNQSKGKKDVDSNQLSAPLDLLWAYTINCKLASDQVQDPKILETYTGLLREFIKTYQLLDITRGSDLDKVVQINHILMSWSFPESLFFTPKNLNVNIKPSLFEQAVLNFGVENILERILFPVESIKRWVFEHAISASQNKKVILIMPDEAYFFKIEESDGQSLEVNTLLKNKRAILDSYGMAFVEMSINDYALSNFNLQSTIKSFSILKYKENKESKQSNLLKKCREFYIKYFNDTYLIEEQDETKVKLMSLQEEQDNDEYPDSDDEDYAN